MSEIRDVAVVGAGPAGLTLALSLVHAGRSVVLFETDRALAKEQRGAAFHPPTMEMLDQLGIAKDILPLGVKVPVWQIRNRQGLIAEFDLSVLGEQTRHPYRFHLSQHLASEALLKALQDEDADVRLGHRFVGFSERSDSVLVRFVDATGAEDELRARYIVGADGAHSEVRKQAGIEFEGFSWPERFLVTNVAYPLESLGFCGTAYISDPKRWAVVLKLSDGIHKDLWRVAYPTDPEVPSEDVLAPEEVQARLKEVLPQISGDIPVVYSNTYRVHQRVASVFHRGRCALAGDAAHINNPIGGFGLNGGVHDAVNLAQALDEALQQPGNHAPLERYGRQRRAVAVEYVQAQSIRNKRQIEEADDAARAARAVELRAISSDPQRSLAYLLDTSMLSSVRRAAEIA